MSLKLLRIGLHQFQQIEKRRRPFVRVNNHQMCCFISSSSAHSCSICEKESKPERVEQMARMRESLRLPNPTETRSRKVQQNPVRTAESGPSRSNKKYFYNVPWLLDQDFTVATQRLPSKIELDCMEWERIIGEDVNIMTSLEREWFRNELNCLDVQQGPPSYQAKLLVCAEHFPTSRKIQFAKFIRVGTSYEMSDPRNENRVHSCVVLHRLGNDKYVLQMVPLNKKPKKNVDFSYMKGKSIRLRKLQTKKIWSEYYFLHDRKFIWPKLGGFELMLYAYKYKPLDKAQFGPDPVELIDKEGGKKFDDSQRKALAAALNLNRPIVAIHGAAGTGKTTLLLECLKHLKHKKVLIIGEMAPLYCLLQRLYQETGRTDFVFFNGLDSEKLEQMVADPTLRDIIGERCVQNDVTHLDSMKYIHYPDIRIYLSKGSYSLQRSFSRHKILFDVVFMDDINDTNAFQTWMQILPTAKRVRMFGNYHGLRYRKSSLTERPDHIHFTRSLIQQLDEQFGDEVNFHLRRQYRSNPAIQAWPNECFRPKRMRAEPDESVRERSLKELLNVTATEVDEERLPTEPMVLVDTSRLDGQWMPSMFQPDQYANQLGEALLATLHIQRLVRNGLPVEKLRYVCHSMHQATMTQNIMDILLPPQQHPRSWTSIVDTNDRVHFCPPGIEVLITSLHGFRNRRGRMLENGDEDDGEEAAGKPPPAYDLRLLQHNLSRPRRQFVLFVPGIESLRETPELEKLLRIFERSGRIVGPNEFYELVPGQVERLRRIDKENQRLKTMKSKK